MYTAHQRVALLLAALPWITTLGGCATEAAVTAVAPASFAVTLYTSTSTLKYTWFELTRDRQLLYAGGRDATARNGAPVTTLTEKQTQEVWDVIYRGRIHEAPAGALFPESKAVRYDFTLNTGGVDHIVRAADDEQPAMKELHDYLFKLQAAIRYDQPRLGK
jgi:hypothetical protein